LPAAIISMDTAPTKTKAPPTPGDEEEHPQGVVESTEEVNESPEQSSRPAEAEDQERAYGLAAAEKEIAAEAESEDETDNTAAVPSESDQEIELPEKLMRTVDVRIGLWQQLLKLEEERREIAELKTTRDVRGEMSRQNNELKRIPNAEALKNTEERLNKKASTPLPEPDEETQQVIAALEEQGLVYEEVYRRLLTVGLKQNAVLVARAQIDPIIPHAAKDIACTEPLVQACTRVGIDAEKVVGWAFFALGVERRVGQCRRREAADREEAKALAANSTKRGRKSKQGYQPDPQLMLFRRAAERELAAIESQLYGFFWDLYEPLVWHYVQDHFTAEENPYVRAMLRFGMVATHPGLLPPDKVAYVIDNCTNDVAEWENSPEANHVVYVDEFIKAVHERKTTPSPDEDLELNQRGSDKWKADRVLRRAAGSAAALAVLETKRVEVEQSINELSTELDGLKEKIEKIRGDAGRKMEMLKLRQRALKLQPELARARQRLERLDEKLIPQLQDGVNDAKDKQDAAQDVLSPEMIVVREAEFVKRLVRLAARLKTPFPHFVLRDKLEVGRSDLHHRAAVLKTVERVEYADRFVFHSVLIPHKKPARRLTARMAPTFLIVPSCGAIGLSLVPRRSTEAGKLMLPLFGSRPEMLDGILISSLADFSWDCSMEDAGADWITADALCSAYANVRWNYRSRPARTQKRAGFNKKAKDRVDWRHHYRLYIDSAKDSGRKLFYACYEVYEVVLRYIGLPEGKERLRRD
jgi:hypothetical protein